MNASAKRAVLAAGIVWAMSGRRTALKKVLAPARRTRIKTTRSSSKFRPR